MELNRKLSSILLSKLGGNVDHSLNTVLQEFIDNSLDDGIKEIDESKIDMKKINIYLENNENIHYLIIEDNGNGIKNIDNIFMGDEAKKDKKGCKNQGFLDSVAYLSRYEGEVDVYTKHQNSYYRINVDFSEMKKEYDRQMLDGNLDSIDYNLCQKKLEDGFMKFNNKHTLETLKSKPEILEKIENGGTYIKIQLHIDFDIEIFKNINIEQFQYLYNENFQLRYMDNILDINDDMNICLEQEFKPAECLFYRSKHSNGTELYSIKTNFGLEVYMKSKKNETLVKIDKDEYNKYLKSCKLTEKIAEFKFSLISGEKASEQADIFNLGIDNLRKLFISYMGKILGPFKYPKKITGLYPRNLYDIRSILEIYDNNLISDIIMTNKSKTNLDNIHYSIIRFIDEIKPYFKIGNEKSSSDHSSSDRPGIPNMIEYCRKQFEKKITDKSKSEKKNIKKIDKQHLEEEISRQQQIEHQLLEEEINRQQLEEKRKQELLEKQQLEEKCKQELLEKQQLEEKRKQELLEKQKQDQEKKANYQSWKNAMYFGILKCSREKGISAEGDRYHIHYGFTKDDPNHRDSGSGLGTGWRRILYCPINSDGSISSAGKRLCEWKIYEKLKENESELGIIWETKEYLSCPKDKFKNICKLIRNVIEIYEADW